MGKPNRKDLIARRKLSSKSFGVDDLFSRIRLGDVMALSKAITLVESNISDDALKGQELIKMCLPYSGNSRRIGITGVPGVGKSSFIEAFAGDYLTQDRKLAVLAIDPSSNKTGGSILGDKTRMHTLSGNENVFIRPSASGKTLGGVARKTRETIILCEAAGYENILIETVGVGQSETAVKNICDMFILLMLAGAGDELQGIKRGIMEMADVILITKADGNNKANSNNAAQSYRNALMLFPPNSNAWEPQVLVTSSEQKVGLKRTSETINAFFQHISENGFFDKNRIEQDLFWFDETLQYLMNKGLHANESVVREIQLAQDQLKSGSISSYQAAERVYQVYLKSILE